jgi:hypothetical protein
VALTVTKVLDLGDDTLQVTGLDGDGNEVTATGWVSAMTNFYPDTAYDETGQRKATAKPRAMTKAEQKNYWLSLLGQGAGTPVEGQATVLFEA